MPKPIDRNHPWIAHLAPALAGFLAVLLCFAQTGCSATKITDSWLDPSVKTLPRFNKVVAVAMDTDPGLRRAAEDAMVANIKRFPAVAAYTFLPDWKGGQLDEVRDRLQKAGVDGVVSVQLVSVDKEQTWMPESPAVYGRTFVRPYTAGLAYPVNPGYLQTDTILKIETNVYSLADGKLLYSARSRTVNPTDAAKTIKEIAAGIGDDLAGKGLLK
jgi:hypothetical protein